METLVHNQITAADIQRLEDAPVNPLSGNAQPNSQLHKELLQARRRLPVYNKAQEILDVYQGNQVMILSGSTGSGKSTIAAQLFLWSESPNPSKLRVACTQPRRHAATALASRVSKEMGVVLGQEVGFQIGGQKMMDQGDKKTRLAYMTEGVLVRKLANDPNLSEYACVIVDEAHERNVDTDLLLAMLKGLIVRRKDLKVVIMSATIDARLFQTYFNNCPLVEITGHMFNVDILYTQPRQALSDFITLTVNVVADIHKDDKPGHILVFLPGENEIQEVCGLVREHTKDLDIFPLYSALSAYEQSQALNTSCANRKCIVSTNIAETSLTVDGVVFIVDTGLSKQPVYNPRLGAQILQLRPISQASAIQRAGRAGRTRDGICYRLYSKEDFDRMLPSNQPGVRYAPLHSALLTLLTSGYTKPMDFDWIEPPHPESVQRAAQDLADWGFLKPTGIPSSSGLAATRCTVDPIWYRAIQAGAKLGCTFNMIDIAALCSSQSSIFVRPSGYQQTADLAMTAFSDPLSDHLTLANAFNAYLRARDLSTKDGPKLDLDAWCTMRFLNKQALEDVRFVRDRLRHWAVKVAKVEASHASILQSAIVRRALAVTFSSQAAMHHLGANEEYHTVHEATPGLLSPLSSLLGANHEWIVYTNFRIVGNRQFMEIATAVNPEWLVRLRFFKEDRFPLRGNGQLRQPNVKASLDAAKARLDQK